MRLALTVVSPAARRQADVLLEADPGTPVGTLAGELDRLLRAGTVPGAGPGTGPGTDPGHVLAFPGPRSATPTTGPTAVYVDQALVPPEQALAGSPIRPGCVVSLGDPAGCMSPEPAGVVEIQVAGGPAAGGVHRLTLGEADIGGADPAHILIADPRLPAAALHVWVDAHGACTVAPYDGVPAELDREPLEGPATWSPGQLVTVGGTLLGLARYERPDAALHVSEDGAGVDFNRPPRLLPPNGPPGSSSPAARPGRNGGRRRS